MLTRLQQGARMVFGPESNHDVSTGGYVQANLDVRDFIAEARVTNCANSSDTNRVIQFAFRSLPTAYQASGASTVGFVNVNTGGGYWQAWLRQDNQRTDLAQGPLAGVNTAQGAANDLRWVASGNVGLLFANGRFLGGFDLSGLLNGGRIGLGSFGPSPGRSQCAVDNLTVYAW